MSWLFPMIAGILAGMAGAMGLGGGSVLLIYLTLFAGISQITAQGINLIFFIPCAVIAYIMYSKSRLIKFKIAAICAGFGLLGAFIGSALTDYIGEQAIRKTFAVILILLGIKELFFKRKLFKNKKDI
jgi:uncharacterized membrane protein YfcA